MNIKYEIHALDNAKGSGNKQKFVSLRLRSPMTEEMMENEIQEACSLTKGDVKAVLAEIRQLVVRQLAHGSRFWVPGIGWLWLSAGLNKDALAGKREITGKDIYPRAIRFRADHKLFEEVAQQVSFTKSGYSTISAKYTEAELWPKVSDFLDHNIFITNKDMREEFGLSAYKARLWLNRLVESGKLLRKKKLHMNIYLRP